MGEEFKILKIQFSSDTRSYHELFYKQHNLKRHQINDAKPTSRTLFVVNVPGYCNESSLKSVFNCFGHVDRVYLHDDISSKDDELKLKSTYFTKGNQFNNFKKAYIVFNNPACVTKALNLLNDEVRIISNNEKQVQTGLRKWINNYRNNFVDATDLQKEIDVFMKEYDLKQEQKEIPENDQFNTVHEDGWITITKSSKKPGLTLTEKNVKRLKSKEKNKQKQKELLNFYSFQMRDTKKEYIAQLRKKFEEDKKQIDVLKINRKFKPF